MGDEKETWKVKTLDEILLEKKRRRELEERTDPKRQKNVKYFKTNLIPMHLGNCTKKFGYLKNSSPMFVLLMSISSSF